MTSRPSSAQRVGQQRAFTLVEMLVVIGIIGLLIALLLPAIMASVNGARRAQISVELKDLGLALETYKQQKGEYPPSFGERNAMGQLVYNQTTGTPNRYTCVVEKHLGARYPKFKDDTSVNNDAKDNFYNQIAINTTNEIDQGEALVLWLAGTSTAAQYPFEGLPSLPAGSVPRNVYFPFDQRRIIDNDGDGFPTYQPRHCRETDYIYMEARTYTTYVRQNFYARAINPNNPNPQNVVPYGTGPTTPVNPTSFQIVCAGFDGDFGALTTPVMNLYPVKVFNSGVNYARGDMDNLTSFSEGSTLGDARPQ